MYTLNGIGTILYGLKLLSKKEISDMHITPKENRPYIATKWFALFFIPLIPLGSYIVIEETKTINHFFSSTKEYSLIKTKINWKQIIHGYLIAIVIFFVCWLLGELFNL